MDPAVLSALVIAVGSLIVGLATVRQNRLGAKATTTLSERVVDREDFESVMNRMEQALNRSDKRIGELETRVEAEVQERMLANERAEAAEKRALAAERRATRLERRVAQLEEVLERNNIQVPPPDPD